MTREAFIQSHAVSQASAVKGASRRGVLALLGGAALTRPTTAIDVIEKSFRLLTKSMWVWKDRIRKPDDLGVFSQYENVHTLFLYTPPMTAQALLAGDRTARNNILTLRGKVQRLYAVAGEPDWALGPNLPEHVQLLVQLQSVQPRLFDGIHLDVEPNALPAWQHPTGRTQLIAGTLKFYSMVRSQAPGIHIDAATNPIFADLKTANGDNFLSELAQRLDSVSLMAYRNQVDKAVAWASSSISIFESLRKPWRMGVAVDADPNAPTTTWAVSSRNQFLAAMVSLDIRMQRQSSGSYQGLAFESFDGLRTLFAGSGGASSN